MSDQRFIPNSFQTPNAVVDVLMPLLTDSEFRVLMFMIREILGWKASAATKQAHISQSVFENGYEWRDSDGNTQSKPGCGLSKNTIRTVLKSLVMYRIIKKVGQPTQKGQQWELCLITDANPDLVSLRLRAKNKEQKQKQRTKKARKVNPKNEGGISATDTLKGVSPTDTEGICPTDTEGVSPTDTNETQGNAEETHIAPPADKKKPQQELGDAFGVPPATKQDYGLYGKVCKQLTEAGIEPDEYPAYVAWVRKQAKDQGGWKVTVSSLIGKGRVSDYVATKSAPAAVTEPVPLDVVKEQELAEERMYKILVGKEIAS